MVTRMLLARTLDNDTRYGRFSQFLSQVLTYFKIAVQVVSEFFGVRKPGRVPWFYNTQANTIRMYFFLPIASLQSLSDRTQPQ